MFKPFSTIRVIREFSHVIAEPRPTVGCLCGDPNKFGRIDSRFATAQWGFVFGSATFSSHETLEGDLLVPSDAIQTWFTTVLADNDADHELLEGAHGLKLSLQKRSDCDAGSSDNLERVRAEMRAQGWSGPPVSPANESAPSQVTAMAWSRWMLESLKFWFRSAFVIPADGAGLAQANALATHETFVKATLGLDCCSPRGGLAPDAWLDASQACQETCVLSRLKCARHAGLLWPIRSAEWMSIESALVKLFSARCFVATVPPVAEKEYHSHDQVASLR
jgi:hypothetical protein